jgi:ATP-binding cassette, subfamily B, bacterial
VQDKTHPTPFIEAFLRRFIGSMKSSLQKYRLLLARYFIPLWRPSLLLALLLFSTIGLRLVTPQILGQFIDTITSGGPGTRLVASALWYLGLSLLLQLFSLGESYLAANIGLRATNRLRADLTEHCLNLDMTFHKRHTPGEMIERIDGDVGTLNNFFSRFLVEVIGGILLLSGILVMLFIIDWRVGLVMMTAAIILVIIIVRIREVAVPEFRKSRQAEADLYGFLEERLSGTEDVRANGAVAYILRRFYETSRPIFKHRPRAAGYGIGSFSILMLVYTVGYTLALATGAGLFLQGSVTIGTVYLIFRYTELMFLPIESLNRQFQELQAVGASAVRIIDLFAEKSAIRDDGKTQLPTGKALSVSLEGVSFSYPDDTGAADKQADESTPDRALHQLTFELPSGNVLGLLGRTGSGKTTLTRLLLRFYEPDQGHVSLGQVRLPDLPISLLRRRVGMVTQDIQLFNASLRNNLSLFDPSISDERILDAFTELKLMDWYHTLTGGLDTKLESGGSGLSAGEAQLLAFVRVFLRDPGLIILDEASSRLDPATEARLERAMARLLQGRTAIIIAHRLGTVQRADRILILENGEMLEYGEREVLASNPRSHFTHLLQVGLEEALV